MRSDKEISESLPDEVGSVGGVDTLASMNSTQNLTEATPEMVTILVDGSYRTGTLVSRHYYDATIRIDSASGGAVTVSGPDIEFF